MYDEMDTNMYPTLKIVTCLNISHTETVSNIYIPVPYVLKYKIYSMIIQCLTLTTNKNSVIICIKYVSSI